MLSANFSSPSTVPNVLAPDSANPNPVGFSGEKKLTQATDIKFGDTFRSISSVFSEPLLKQVNQEID
uniref:hypothetical protein n=1 Tax=Endozoicomonas sp. YOMI1 TaxID=2828739 RepID=UPI0021494F81